MLPHSGIELCSIWAELMILLENFENRKRNNLKIKTTL